MAYDYDKLYGETRDALGEPYQAFVDFFAGYERERARVFDVGCGQGRDAIFIARLGHSVIGVDLSPNGIRDLDAAAKRDKLDITGIVADIATYVPEGQFDVVVIDRTLHMLEQPERLAVLAVLLDHVAANGWLLIADEAENIQDFETLITAHGASWTTEQSKDGILFVRRS